MALAGNSQQQRAMAVESGESHAARSYAESRTGWEESSD